MDTSELTYIFQYEYDRHGRRMKEGSEKVVEEARAMQKQTLTLAIDCGAHLKT